MGEDAGGSNRLPEGVPPVFRGGRSLECRPHDVKLDPVTSLLKTSHGVSVSADADSLRAFGGAYRVLSIPPTLDIRQRGRNPQHYELTPRSPMTLAQYQDQLRLVELAPNPEAP